MARDAAALAQMTETVSPPRTALVPCGLLRLRPKTRQSDNVHNRGHRVRPRQRPALP